MRHADACRNKDASRLLQAGHETRRLHGDAVCRSEASSPAGVRCSDRLRRRDRAHQQPRTTGGRRLRRAPGLGSSTRAVCKRKSRRSFRRSDAQLGHSPQASSVKICMEQLPRMHSRVCMGGDPRAHVFLLPAAACVAQDAATLVRPLRSYVRQRTAVSRASSSGCAKLEGHPETQNGNEGGNVSAVDSSALNTSSISMQAMPMQSDGACAASLLPDNTPVGVRESLSRAPASRAPPRAHACRASEEAEEASIDEGSPAPETDETPHERSGAQQSQAQVRSQGEQYNVRCRRNACS
eukprot:349632-Chlamydomonas_euryale.AAC.2